MMHVHEGFIVPTAIFFAESIRIVQRESNAISFYKNHIFQLTPSRIYFGYTVYTISIIHHKYWETLTLYHTCPKIGTSILLKLKTVG